MTIPPPHPDDTFAAALDAFNVVATTDPVRLPDLLVAFQAICAAGLRKLAQQNDQAQRTTGAQFEEINRKLDRILAPAALAQLEQRPVTAQELHDLRGQVQRMMEHAILARENQHAITVLHEMLEALGARLDWAVARIDLIERAVGDRS